MIVEYAFYFYIMGNNLTVLNLTLCTLTSGITFSPMIREQFYCLIFPNVISKHKLEYKWTWDDYKGVFNLTVEYVIGLAIGTYYGYVNWNYTNFFDTYLEISIQYWVMVLVKDFTSLYFLHPWMHKPENY